MKRVCLLAFLAVTLASCDSVLEYQPKGALSGENLDTPARVEDLVIAAYAALANDHWTTPYTSGWAYGSVRSDDAYKGGGGLADQEGFNTYERFTSIRPNMSKGDRIWWRLYVGVGRANSALKAIQELDTDEYPDYPTKVRAAEMRFIRGFFYFNLKTLFKHIPWIDEDVSRDSMQYISNVEFTSQELWDKIAQDFRYAAENLPVSQPAVGRANKYAAKAFLAKTLLYSAYVQNAQHQVVDIDEEELREVVSLVSEIQTSGQYALFDQFGKLWLWEYENGKGMVFSVQRSINDGTVEGRVDIPHALNFPMYSEFGCCWFHIPSQNLVNAFRTGEDGLPLFETFNEISLDEPEDFQNYTVDPRLDHTVAIPGHPFKYDPELIYNLSWARTPKVYGPYSSEKELVHPDCPCLTLMKGYPYPASSKNTIIIRYADVLLWKAEALIELGRQMEALPIINKIRTRAANSTAMLANANGEPVSNYHIEPYKPGININWTQENARRALRWERRLEFGMEGTRFFDLVRWGIAAETLNEYFEVERQRHEYLREAHFTEGRDEYLPIPQQQIDFSGGLYEQNPGWPGG